MSKARRAKKKAKKRKTLWVVLLSILGAVVGETTYQIAKKQS